MSLMKCLAAGVALTLLSVPTLVTAQEAGPERLQGLWNDLGSEEESNASRALLQLTRTPKETLALLQQNLRPVKVDEAQVAKLVADLDSSKFTRREAAAKELEYLGKFARPLLEKHLKDTKSAEVQKRLKELIGRIPTEPVAAAPPKDPQEKPLMQGRGITITTIAGQRKIIVDGVVIDPSQANTGPAVVVVRPNLGWQRAIRAVSLLEHLGTPEARQLLKTMAEGERDAPPTKAAREALERLGK